MKIAIVTGASSGLGREFARKIPALYKSIDEIWLVARRADRLNQLKEELRTKTIVPVRIFCGDLEKLKVYEEINQALDAQDADIRMLVNNAGFGKMGDAKDQGMKEQLEMVELNCKALTHMTLLCLPYMSEGTRIIQVASAAAFAPQPGFSIYAATKAYVYSFSRSLGVELKERGIVVTTVCPGSVETEFFDRAGKFGNADKYRLMAKADKVACQALRDAVYKKEVSTYGIGMKLARVAAKVLPVCAVMKTMRQLNTKD